MFQKSSSVWFDVKLKATILTRSIFMFFESSYFHLKFGIKQSKIGSPSNSYRKLKFRASLMIDD